MLQQEVQKTLDTLLPLSISQFSHWENGNHDSTHLIGLLGRLKERLRIKGSKHIQGSTGWIHQLGQRNGVMKRGVRKRDGDLYQHLCYMEYQVSGGKSPKDSKPSMHPSSMSDLPGGTDRQQGFHGEVKLLAAAAWAHFLPVLHEQAAGAKEGKPLPSRTQAQNNLEAVHTGNSITHSVTANTATTQGVRRLGFPTGFNQPLMT